MTSDPENEGKGFKVEDKRKFTSEGELRSEEPEAKPEAKNAPPEAPEAPGGAGEPEKPGKEEAAPEAESPRATHKPETTAGSEVGPPPDLGFLDLVNMLAGNALVGLGDLPEPVSGKHAENLDSVQVMIAFLSVLQDKTKGNLEEREEKILDDLLYDLRMRFMAKANLIKL